MPNRTKKDLDWGTMEFAYQKTDYRFEAYHDGKEWNTGEIVTDNRITLHEGSTSLHYGQQCFEGLKAYQAKNGDVLLFRPEENAKRMADTAERLLMPSVSEDMFVKAVTETVKANYAWIPPYGYGASLYIRPLLIGIGKNIGLKKAPEYLFRVFVTPVGRYFKRGGLETVVMAVTDYDRAAPQGIGGFKAGANYAGGLDSTLRAKELGADEAIYLDSTHRKYLDEAGSANIVVKMKHDEICTPKSASILPSITRRSIMILAEKELGLNVAERNIAFPDEYEAMEEMFACGTAAVVSPIGKVINSGKTYPFFDNGKSPGPVTKKLYDLLVGIQYGDIKDKYNWVTTVSVE